MESINNTDIVMKALEFATRCHRGQYDKAGCEYIEHPKRVAAKCLNDDEKAVALLHDTMEDCGVTAEMLRKQGFSEEIISAVQACTKNENEDYFDYVRRAGANRIGRVVKMHDLEDNMNLLRLTSLCHAPLEIREHDIRKGECCVLGEKDLYRLNKYLAAYRILQKMAVQSSKAEPTA